MPCRSQTIDMIGRAGIGTKAEIYDAQREMARGMKRFDGFVKDYIKSSKGDIDKAVRRVALQLLRKIIQKTPVDTGRARSGWYPAMVELGGKAPGTWDAGDGDIQTKYAFVSIINNVKYIEELEFGHSKQAPYGMVRLSMLEMQVGRENLPDVILDTYRDMFNIKSKKLPPLRARA